MAFCLQATTHHQKTNIDQDLGRRNQSAPKELGASTYARMTSSSYETQ